MDQDFDTFLVGLYVIVCDWLKAEGPQYIRPLGGSPRLCAIHVPRQIALAGQEDDVSLEEAGGMRAVCPRTVHGVHWVCLLFSGPPHLSSCDMNSRWADSTKSMMTYQG